MKFNPGDLFWLERSVQLYREDSRRIFVLKGSKDCKNADWVIPIHNIKGYSFGDVLCKFGVGFIQHCNLYRYLGNPVFKQIT